MKLFQKLLLAPAAIGLFAPIAANANESNYRDVTSYSQDQVEVSLDTFKPLSSKNPLLAGGEGASQSSSNSDFDVDTFSSTTTASFTSNFAVGTQEGVTGADDLGMNFDWEIALTSSFTGNDSLDVVLNSGISNLYTELDMTHSKSGSSGARLLLDSISYTTPLGERVTSFVAFGDGVVGSTLYNTACVYGAQADTFSNCGISAANIDEGLGTAAGFSLDFENGITAGLSMESQGSSNGLLNKESRDAVGAQVAYTGDNYGVSLSWANIDNAGNAGNTASLGVNGYYSPDLSSFPSISAGIETNHDNTISGTAADQTGHYFVGLQWDEVGNGTFGAAFGSKTPFTEGTEALNMYEVFYSYNYADGITMTPLIFSKDGGAGVNDETGLVLKTTFSF